MTAELRPMSLGEILDRTALVFIAVLLELAGASRSE
jgi:hypothetical protein